MSSCQQCGTEHPIDAQTCAMCGATLEPQLTANDAQPSPISLQKQRTSGFAIAALFLSLPCLHPFLALVCAPLSWVCGVIALVQINHRQETMNGSSRAAWGIIFSIIFPIASLFLFDGIWFPDRHHNPGQLCSSNQRQIALAMQFYTQENEEVLPGKAGLTPWSSDADKQRWRTKDIQDVTASVFDCQSSKLTGAPGQQAEYAMNADLMGVSLNAIPVPTNTLLTADVKGVDALFSANDIDPRHSGGFLASFVDGHIQYIKDTLHDPPQTTLRTAADYITLPPPAINKLIIQGATNVIEIKLHDWHDNPICIAHSGKKLTTWIGENGYLGAYITAYYSELPKKGKPRDITIGTFTNGSNGSPTRLVMPAAGGVPEVFATYWLPPVIGQSPAAGHPAYTGYRMTCESGKGVSIVPVVQ